MAGAAKGLPMTTKWDAEKLQRETAELQAIERLPLLQRASAYVKRTGPGLLQSAMTLGAGSAAASVVAGASFGYKLLWIQPAAMFLGVCMLAALGNVVLTTGERPYGAFGRETSRFLVFLWALGTVVASIIWHFPQYTLAAGAARDLVTSLTPLQLETPGAGGASLTAAGLAVSFLAGVAILGLNMFTTWNYGGNSRGIRMYEWFLRGVIGLVMLSFGFVVVANIGKIDWLELGKGLIGYYGIPAVSAAEGVTATQRDSLTLALGMLGASVGINMTFLYPYSLLAKGWGKHHKTLSRWDLAMTMFLPFVLVTSLVIVAMTVTGVYRPDAEMVRAEMSPLQASQSLSGVIGERVGRVVFNLGLIGMSCGAISAHMVVCGFTLCEMFGLEYTTRRYRMFTLVPAIGLMGVVFNINRVIWFPIVASAICFTMLPIAYVLFLIMNNKRSYIGDAVGSGWRRIAFNAILLVALSVAAIGSAIKVKSGVIDKIWSMFGSAQPATANRADAPAERSVRASAGDEGVNAWLDQRAAAVNRDAAGQLVLVDFTDRSIEDSDLQRLGDQSYLKNVKCTRCPVTDAGVDYLASLPRLVSLGLDDCQITDAGAAKAASIAGLKELFLGGTAVGDQGAAAIAKLGGLQRLRLARTRITDASLPALAGCSSLEDLDVSETAVSDAGLASLASLPQLHKLNLYTTPVTDAGLDLISRLHTLQWLNLDNTKITDAGVPKLQPLGQLEFLHLGRTAITDAAVPALAAMQSLKTLHVTRTGISEDGARQLRESLPGCEVLSGNPDQ